MKQKSLLLLRDKSHWAPAFAGATVVFEMTIQFTAVAPAKAGAQAFRSRLLKSLGPSFRWDDSAFTIISDNKAKKAADGTYDRPALFLNCEAWGLDGRKAVEHLDKGSLVQLRGQLYYDEVGEEKRRYWALTVNDFWLISKVQYTKPEENTEKPKEDATKAPAKTRKPKNNGTSNEESKSEPKQEHDIPF
mgnify:CR=1 FL=1